MNESRSTEAGGPAPAAGPMGAGPAPASGDVASMGGAPVGAPPAPPAPSPDRPGTSADSSPAGPAEGVVDMEALVGSLEAVTTERDTYLADLQRVTAEFSNFRRQAVKRQSETVEHAASGLAAKLLPVLDACDAALVQGASDVEPIYGALVETLRKEGLEVLAEAGAPFDPELHEAVMHEAGEGAEPTVAEIMRSGYVWNGRVLRPAMVRVKG